MTDLERVVTLVAELTLYVAAVARNALPPNSGAAREHIWRKSEELRGALGQ